MKISKLKNNPNNPRLIKDDNFHKLVQSLKEFPKMMELRPIIVDNDYTILGGNMRYKALVELGYKDIPNEWVKLSNDLTEEEKKQFIIKDNLGYGEWDWDILANEWDIGELETWGLEMPVKGDWSKLDYIEDEIAPPSKSLTITIVVPEELRDTMAEIENKIKLAIVEYSGCEVK